ncbi:hypothetical protein L798_00002, partial [Zootermopsis nevadensis]
PPRSPDLSSQDLYLWGCMEENVCVMEAMDRDDVINSNEVVAAGIVRRQLVFVRGPIRHRYEACVQAGGGHFEHLL